LKNPPAKNATSTTSTTVNLFPFQLDRILENRAIVSKKVRFEKYEIFTKLLWACFDVGFADLVVLVPPAEGRSNHVIEDGDAACFEG